MVFQDWLPSNFGHWITLRITWFKLAWKARKNDTYSYVSNKRACAFILFETFMQPCTVLFEPARLLIVEVTILPARLLKPAPFGFFYLYSVKSAEIATKLLEQPRCSNSGQILIKNPLLT